MNGAVLHSKNKRATELKKSKIPTRFPLEPLKIIAVVWLIGMVSRASIQAFRGRDLRIR